MFERSVGNRFLVVGRAGLDLYADPPGTRIEDAVKFSAALGGSAGNIAVALAKQGASAALLTSVSNDAVGRFTTKSLESYGVDTSLVKTVGGELRNSLAVVETRAENCQSVIYRNDAADFAFLEADAAAVNYKAYSTLIVTGTALAKQPSRDATFKALRLAKQAGLTLVIDIDYRPYSWSSRDEAKELCTAAAELCDIVVGNDEEFAVLAGAGDGLSCAQNLAHSANRVVVYKMGAKGCISFAREQTFETPIWPVTALKPTGAGDGFMGGLMAGLSTGTPLVDAVRRGAATAAVVVTRVGCAPAMPTTAEVLAFMNDSAS